MKLAGYLHRALAALEETLAAEGAYSAERGRRSGRARAGHDYGRPEQRRHAEVLSLEQRRRLHSEHAAAVAPALEELGELPSIRAALDARRYHAAGQALQ